MTDSTQTELDTYDAAAIEHGADWSLPRLAPGTYRIEAEWDGRALAAQEVVVTKGEATTVTLSP